MSKIHVVKQGEWLQKIAEQHGFASWKSIYFFDPDNAAFRAKRPNPNVILPGDEIAIPTPGKKSEIIFTGTNHKAVVIDDEPDFVRLTPRDPGGASLVGRRFELIIGSSVLRGAIDGTGVIETQLPAGTSDDAATLTVFGENEGDEATTWTLKIGHLDPVELTTGLKARLNNLRFFCGEVDDHFDATTETAVRQFQKRHRLPVDGKANPATCAKLVEVYGS
jgi:hypothetical protein